MAPHFSYFVIGAGSGGIASARRAASYGAKVAVAEGGRLGGTCVNVGCVPKKMMWLCATIKEALCDSQHYGFTLPRTPEFSWAKMKEARDRSIKRLNGIYQSNLESSGVTLFNGLASFVGKEGDIVKLKVGSEIVTADHVLIATGGCPAPLDLPGAEYCLNSDDFFALDEQPKRVAVVGAGYIAVELASVFTLLGSDTHLFTRGKTALRKFDAMVATELHKEMARQGCTMHPERELAEVTKDPTSGLLTLKTKQGERLENFNAVLVAIGRAPDTRHLALHRLETLECSPHGHVLVDDYQNTSVPNVYAVGDVCGKVELTPMAIAAGRRLADRLFGNLPDAKVDYDNVPTVIFTHPPIGCIGLSETDARKRYGDDNIRVYRSTSVNMYYNAFDIPPQEKPKIQIKVVCLKPENDKILGMHIIGMGADEMLQGFGVAIKMGATKADLDRCIAIHPTAAEEVVTLPPWGLVP